MEVSMKFLIAGAGAIGSHYGSVLQQAGLEVALLGRGEHLAAMQSAGLRHESLGIEKLVAVQADSDPSIAAGADVIVLTCKNTGLDAMCRELQPYVRPEAVLLTLQNGVTAPDVVRNYFPSHTILAGSAFIGARVEVPGYVIHSAAGHLRLGHWHGPHHLALQVVVDAFADAGVDCESVDDPRWLLWHKMLWNCGFNAITALTRRFARDIARDPQTSALVHEAMEEVRSVAMALGIHLEEKDVEKQLQVTRELGPVKSSMWQDIEAGRMTEIDAMNGHVVEQARIVGLQAPVSSMLTTLMHALEQR